jgi:beta-glucosidase
MAELAGPAAVPVPPGFLWGAATASHQVEGGNRWNDWWELEESGRLPHRSGEACRHYELYERDFDLAQSLGHNAHRLSLEWSRIEPEPGAWNEPALAHYAQVIRALRRRGIEPVVTLHHFTNPAWLARRGGWPAPGCIEAFRRYVEIVAARLAGEVRYWITVNEPTVYVKHAYVSCDWPPLGPPSWLQAARALRNLCRAHAAAYAILHRHRPDASVGLAHSAPHVVPCNPASRADRLAARARDFALNRLVFRLFGRPARDVLDFIGLNYYARQVVRARDASGWKPFGVECTEDHHGAARAFSPLGWEVFPAGLGAVLREFARFGLPLLVTENGIATDDERQRTRYLLDHVGEVGNALRSGVPVVGYLYWTLMDNYEWSAGRSPRFGLAHVDFATQERRPRPAAEALRSIIAAGRIG